MSFWSSELLKSRLIEVVPQGNAKRVHQGAYELSLGPEAYISGDEEKKSLEPGDMIQIAAGQIAVLITEERVELPAGVLGFISLKSSVKLPGLINVSGFHVDPGFKGRLIFTVYNAGSETCCFHRGDEMFLIWFTDMNDQSDPYNGKNQEQMSIPSAVTTRLSAKNVSPAQLDKRLESVEHKINLLLFPIIIGIVLLLARAIFDATSNSKSETAQQTQVAPSVGTQPKSPTLSAAVKPDDNEGSKPAIYRVPAQSAVDGADQPTSRTSHAGTGSEPQTPTTTTSGPATKPQ